MRKRIAVLGAGGTGCTIAADLTLAGFDVNLYEEVGYKDIRIKYYLLIRRC